MKKKNVWKSMSGAFRVFLIAALVFLAVGLGTLGSAASVGKSYVLSKRAEGDDKDPSVIIQLTDPGHGEEGHEHSDLYVKEIYFNFGAIYTEPGKVAHLRVARGSSTLSSYMTYVDIGFENLLPGEGQNAEQDVRTDAVFNWVKYTVTTSGGWSLSTYPYYKLFAVDCDMMLNEIVFVGTERDGEEPVVLSATVNQTSILPYNAARGESQEEALKKASAIIDRQRIPSLAQSSFFRFGESEIPTLLAVGEMRRGGEYDAGEVYSLDRIHNALGTDLVALSAAVFGMSPFGIRLVPFLFAFLTLVFGFLLTRRLGGDKAGALFSLLFVLAGIPFAVGHLASPMAIGVGFFTMALYFAVCYFKDGVKEAKFASAMPALLAGLFTACAICTDGVFAVPAVAVVGLFVAGLVRQVKERRAVLDGAIEAAEAEESAPQKPVQSAPEGSEPAEAPVSAKQKVANVLNEYRFKISAASVFFFAAAVLGALLISVLAALPLYYSFVKLYDTPASPQNSIFYFMWKAFSGGYAGQNAVGMQTGVPFVYVLFRGAGEKFAVTATGTLMAIVPAVAGLAGAVFLLVSLFRHTGAADFYEKLGGAAVLLFVAALGRIVCFFARETLPFLFVSLLMLFAFAGTGFSASEEAGGKTAKAGRIVALVLLFASAVLFGLFSIYTFSIPAAGFLRL